MKHKIAVIASSRATYGYKRKLIGLIHRSEKLELQLIVTGMHLLKQYGYSVQEIEADRYPITARVDMMIGGDTPAAWVKSIGVEIQSLAQVFDMIKPDLVLVTGDRAEMFAAAVSAAYMNLPIAHIQAGDVSGHIDGNTRHAITKMGHIHLASCKDSADRVIKLGEEPWRVFDVGAPQLDDIIHGHQVSKSEIEAAVNIDLDKPFALVIQHATLTEADQAYDQMKETMLALKDLKMQAVVIYPNVDSGGMEIIRAIKEFQELPFIINAQNIERKIFIGLLRNASVLLGNSSCGILEAPSFKLPAINIGNRQRGRMQAVNVINVEYDHKEIIKAVNYALNDSDFKRTLKDCVNPYGDGRSSEKILEVLENLDYGPKLLDKIITY
jgi:GDP/UDP-N,N'-diacetylbacillosamine 2-epimerase (hydrolysing)